VRRRYAPSRYHKIRHDREAIAELFVTLLLEAHARPPKRIIIDFDASDDPLHGHQEGRFFHAYYDCYCYLPLYVFCGRHLLAVKLGRSRLRRARARRSPDRGPDPKGRAPLACLPQQESAHPGGLRLSITTGGDDVLHVSPHVTVP
jgi:Transposase DDE domain group 1